MKDFEEYVTKYAEEHKISVEEAKQHAMVKEVEKYFKDKNKNSIVG